MSSTVLVGMQWGDEGKGKISDFLSSKFDIVVRFNGGGNAGHTVFYKGREVKLHYIPAGVFHKKLCLLGNGMVINPKDLYDEIKLVEEMGVEPNLAISRRAQVILPFHIRTDRIKGGLIGTTGKGIGPTYVDKMARVNLRMGSLSGKDASKRIKIAIKRKKAELIATGIVKENEFDNFITSVAEEYTEYGRELKKYISDTYLLVNNAFKEGKSIFFEGAQGIMLDIDFGTYPFVTSSNTIAQGALTGAGANPFYIKRIVGVSKAYTTRVGEGPFPTEIQGEKGNLLRKLGNEFGATTGRPRRVGYLDLFALKYAVDVSAVTEIALTKIDVLSMLDEVRVAVGYKLNRKSISVFPSDADVLYKVDPIYKEVESLERLSKEEWKQFKGKPKEFLPKGIKRYINFIEEFLGIPITILSFGPEGNDTITYENE